ncbi:hypothetical protein D6C78_07160 [Aureobasidium pullulans]|uniref:Uncharacterized protein n=1 Tax=Aureobasidium pullulans TaxID=5580 RepID=A0A4T0BJ92_AURPU|nr:hypothetical protein D6C78_07160 [Aureobasidium pullulans]
MSPSCPWGHELLLRFRPCSGSTRARSHSECGRRGGHTLRPLRLDEHEIRRSNVNRRDDWDFERDTAFATDCLLPWTKELLDSGGRPTIDSFEAFRWLDTRAPGVYACLAIKKDKSGRIIAVRMKVGCAWSFEGGLKARQRTHLNDEQSKKDPFHMCIQTTDPNQEDLELKWLTLAVGMPFIRETQADDYLAARYYQSEAMLASALDPSTRRATTTNSMACNGGHTTEAWKGGDHHCSIRDIWTKRPTMRTEDEIAEREAAARVVETTRVRKQQRAAVYLCTHTGCEREQRGCGFGSIQALEGHHAWYNRDIAIAEDRYLCTITGCDRAILGRGLATPLALQQHMVFHFKLGNDAYLCTYDQCGRSQAGKGFKTLQTLERHLTRYYQLEPPRVLNLSPLATSRDRDYGHPG